MPLSSVFLLASGMLTIVWLSSENLRARDRTRNPNARILFWVLVAGVSVLGYIK